MKILHFMIQPRGWIAVAKMFSLVIENGSLYILYTGRAADPTGLFLKTPSRWGVAPKLFQNKYNQEIFPNQKHIESVGAEAFLHSSKKSSKLPLSSIKEVEVRDSVWGGCSFRFEANGKKYTFIFDRPRMEEVSTFSSFFS